MFGCNIAVCRYVAVLCMLMKFRYISVHPLMVLYRAECHIAGYTWSFDHTLVYLCIYLMTLNESMWNDHVDPVFNGVGLANFKSSANAFYWPCCSLPFCLVFTVFIFSSFFIWIGFSY